MKTYILNRDYKQDKSIEYSLVTSDLEGHSKGSFI